MVTKGKNHVLR